MKFKETSTGTLYEVKTLELIPSNQRKYPETYKIIIRKDNEDVRVTFKEGHLVP